MPTIIYNGYTIPNVFGKFNFNETYKSASLKCNFFITAASASALVTACATAESKLREWNKDLTLSFGGTAEYSYSHAANTGFLAQPSLTKLASEIDTETCRGYSFAVEFSLPADQSGYNYRQSGEINFSRTMSTRKILTVSGTYTAGGAVSAYNNFATYGLPWADSIANSFWPATYELQSSDASYEQEDKICKFTRVYQEKLSLSVVYNGYTIPGTYNKFTIQESYESFTLSLEFAIAHASVTAMETALRIYNADLSVTLGGSLKYSFSHSSNTGFLAKPTVSRISNTATTDPYAFYSFNVVCQLPANKAGYNYRQSGNYTVTYDPARRRTVRFSLVYTAGSTKSSLENYQSYGKTWAVGILSALGGTYELTGENANSDHETKITNASLTYTELLAKDSSAALNDVDIVNASCTYSVSIPQEVGYSTGGFTAKPQAMVTVNYTAQLDRELNVDEDSLAKEYQDTIRPWLIANAYTVLHLDHLTTKGTAGSNYIVQAENYALNPHVSTISGSLTFYAVHATTQILSLQESINENLHEGIAYQKIWDGQDYSYSIYRMGKQLQLTRSITVMQLNSEPGDPNPYGNTKWIRLRLGKTKSIKLLGAGSVTAGTSLRDNTTYYIVSFQEEYLFADKVY